MKYLRKAALVIIDEVGFRDRRKVCVNNKV